MLDLDHSKSGRVLQQFEDFLMSELKPSTNTILPIYSDGKGIRNLFFGAFQLRANRALPGRVEILSISY